MQLQILRTLTIKGDYSSGLDNLRAIAQNTTHNVGDFPMIPTSQPNASTKSLTYTDQLKLCDHTTG